MAKVNLFAKRAPVYQAETATFTAYDGTEYTFTLRPLNELEDAAAEEFAEKLSIRFLTGGYTDPQGDRRDKPEILVMVPDEQGGEKPAELSIEILLLLARLERMQGIRRDVFDDEPREDAYTAKELVLLALIAPEVWKELRTFRRKVQARAGQKKAPAGSDGTSPTPGSAPDGATPPTSST